MRSIVLSHRDLSHVQPSTAAAIAREVGIEICVDSTHGLAREEDTVGDSDQLYNILGIDNNGEGVIIASFFCGNNETLTVAAGMRWVCHQLRERGVDLYPDSILVDDAAGLHSALKQVFPRPGERALMDDHPGGCSASSVVLTMECGCVVQSVS